MGGIDLIQDLGLVMLVAAFAAWLCQRIGLPAVIGYLGAGVLVSPHTHAAGLIGDVGRIQALAQVGLVFLIFNIGQGLTLQRLKRAGMPLVIGAVLIATFVLAACRWLGTVLGWPGEHSLVLAAILMVSSTAVLGKAIRGAKQSHTTFGRAALTLTALDDLAAVAMLTLLASLAQPGGTDAAAVFGAAIRLAAVTVAMAIGALLLLPPLLKHLNRSSPEAGRLAMAGILLCIALISAKAGFSAALGAFLLGMIVSTTGNNGHAGRAAGALSEVFGPVFFVSMGMLLNLQVLIAAWPMVLGVLALAVVLRIAAGTAALLMVGQSVANASRAAICLMPVGEFSLILALSAVQGGIVPETFYAAAFAACIFTAVSAPFLIRRSRQIGGWIETRQPQSFAHLAGLYQEWIENLKQRQNASFLWRLTAPRVVQVAILVLFVSGLLSFASPLFLWIQKWIGPEGKLAGGFPVLFWSSFLFLIVAPLVAIWRQIEALSLICADAVTKSRPSRSALKPVLEMLLRFVAVTAVSIWFGTIIPYEALAPKGLLLLGIGAVLVAAFFWRRLIRLQSRFELELRAQLAESPFAIEKPGLPGWRNQNGHCRMSLAEVALNDHANGAGLRIADLPLRSKFACNIVRIERQGIVLPNPGPETILFPNDRLLLLGAEQNLEAAEAWLNEPRRQHEISAQPALSELSLGHLLVPSASRHAGKSLRELGLRSQFGIQVVGIERGHNSVLTPGPHDSFAPGDQLLVLGTPEQVSDVAMWLSN